MSRHFEKERALQALIEAEVERKLDGFDVLDVELDEPRETVRVFIDHAQGIGFEECEAVTEAIRDTCEEYALEVSSPGLERPMRYARHFVDHIGSQIRVREAGKHRATQAGLVAVDGNEIVVQADGGDERRIELDNLVRARLVPEDPFASAGKKTRGKRKGRK